MQWLQQVDSPSTEHADILCGAMGCTQFEIICDNRACIVRNCRELICPTLNCFIFFGA